MREIKFRARPIDLETYPHLIKFSLNEIGNWDASCGVFYTNGVACSIESIQQYTGLKDENEKEIFEGDVVKGSFAPRQAINIVSEIIFYKGSFVLKKFMDSIGVYSVDFEIIGNIYENPELLKETPNE